MVDQATDISARQSPKHRLGMLAVLGGLSAFGPLAMDMYLPATPTIAAALHAGQSLVQLTLSGCLAGLAVGQLVAGPVSDGIGRRRPLLVGLVAFVVLSVACAAAPDIWSLIVFRFLQGMAGAVGVVLSLTIVRDLYEGTELARVLSSLMLVFGLAPVLAPVIGGQVLRVTSWRGVFGVLAAVGLVLLVAGGSCRRRCRRSVARRPGSASSLSDSRTLVRDRQYAGNALAVTFGTAALITYISALPFIVEDAYHQSPQVFSLFFAINSVGLVAMAQLGNRLIRSAAGGAGRPRVAARHDRWRGRLPGCGADGASAAGGPARPALRVRGVVRNGASERDRACPGRSGLDRGHGIGLAGRAAVPARRGALPAGRPWRPGRRHGGWGAARRALRGGAGQPGADYPSGVIPAPWSSW